MKTTFKLVAFLLTITLLSCNANLNLNDGVEGSGAQDEAAQRILLAITYYDIQPGIRLALAIGEGAGIRPHTGQTGDALLPCAPAGLTIAHANRPARGTVEQRVVGSQVQRRVVEQQACRN